MRSGIFALFMLASAKANAAVAGFEGLDWGMTHQQVQTQYPNFEEWDEPDFDIFSGKQVVKHRYGLRSHIAAGCNFELKLEFSDNKLVQALLDQNLADSTDCRAIVRKQLYDKYGSKHLLSNAADFNILTWNQGKTIQDNRCPQDSKSLRN